MRNQATALVRQTVTAAHHLLEIAGLVDAPGPIDYWSVAAFLIPQKRPPPAAL